MLIVPICVVILRNLNSTIEIGQGCHWHIKSKCYKLQNKIKRNTKNEQRDKKKAEVVDSSITEDRGDDLF